MVTKKIAEIYSLRKSRHVLQTAHRLYKRKEHTLDSSTKERLQSHMSSLQRAILQKDVEMANRIAHQLETTVKQLIPRTRLDKAKDLAGAILFALAIAIVIRQMWFEPYSIPTGSMRPTLKENDFLVVTKTDYGVNVPLSTSHFYFDPTLMQRGAITVFTSDHIDLPDTDTVYFFLFPGKKQFVKRLIGKPGDTLYFYGGEIYGVSGAGKELTMLRDATWFRSLEHIPFIRFDGKVEAHHVGVNGVSNPVYFYQMNQPVAKLSVTPIGTPVGEMLPLKGRPPLSQYSDLWGMKNFAMARLLTKAQVDKLYPDALKELEEGVLYLELFHHPTLLGAQIIRDEYGRIRPDLAMSSSLLPLSQSHLDRIVQHMTTARFTVKKTKAYRLGWNPKDMPQLLPHLDIPDGTYEMINGEAYRVYFGGITKKLPSKHPLYRTDPEQIQTLYNLGIEFLNHYQPSAKNQRALPSRYAYFRNHDLFLLGAPILSKDDPALIRFIKREYQKQSMSTSVRPYIPFDDNGPPLTQDGKIDVDFIRKYGIQVPDKMYLVLGDNHAMSADSRAFGFVPEENFKGGVTFRFWPPGETLGRLSQPPHPLLTLPNLFVWIGAATIAIATSVYYKRKYSKPLF
jgi:signal peptidase I